jgi:hypothetical protein
MTNFEYYNDELLEWVKNKSSCKTCFCRKYCEGAPIDMSCPSKIICWGSEEYVPQKPERHTMQELSDFFGCSFAKDKSGDIFICTEIPKVENEEWIKGGFLGIFPPELISDGDSHNWTVLVTPKKNNE